MDQLSSEEHVQWKSGPESITPYNPDIEEHMLTFYHMLSEKEQRL